MTTRKTFPASEMGLHLPRVQFTERERYLDRLEEAWADAAHALRSGMPYRQTRRGKLQVQTRTLLRIHTYLENLRAAYANGDKTALFDALKVCLEENLPLPYWAANGLLVAMSDIAGKPGLSLHAALDLGARYPLTRTRAKSSQKSWENAVRMWEFVCQHPAYPAHYTTAIREVLKAHPELPFSPRKAHGLFKRVELAQTKYHGKIGRCR